MPEFSEEQLNAVAEELFERMAVTLEEQKALMDQPVPPVLSKEVPEPVTQLSEVGKEEIQAEARKLERDVGVERIRADRFDLAEVFLEVGLVITSITLLSGRRLFWYLGMVFGVVGIVVAVTGALIR